MTSYAAVLWDLDGTIVDTEPLWMAAEHALAERHGKIWTEEDALELVGNSLIVSGEYIRTKLEIDMTAEAIVEYLVDSLVASLREHIDWRPGARELIAALAAEGVPQALVTMSYTAIAEPIAAALPFAAVVTGDTVSRPKPYPDPYLLAAEKLGVDASDCLAIEDSRTGAASATAAGCDVLVVPHFVTVPEAERRVLLPTLAGLTPGHLDSLFATAP
ncbi:HAD family hydrolase [Aeromicrobium wangtongii]|uniref:HAD family phosphatase n=1 Tax=Aeromicrobium wangtongii TaxID=2969247 RepID=A0ABY5M1J8_9ACTN|nr:HAD family phosphatase [Aeromicrobium wangtongii]MCD9198038.1 HAD family phosphatase [Aeromicrobium wangtongii]UUP12080.1 HAD family phosphatase [Aeromicrobium wangtongii]